MILILDATFFGRSYGILLARSPEKTMYWQEIASESMHEYQRLLDQLQAMDYKFSGFVIDGRRGARQFLERRYSWVPVQVCQFHQMQTVGSRYSPSICFIKRSKSLLSI
jgi:hypothetical protein